MYDFFDLKIRDPNERSPVYQEPLEEFKVPRLRSGDASLARLANVECCVGPSGCAVCKRKMNVGEMRFSFVPFSINLCLSCAEKYFRDVADAAQEWREHPDRRRLLRGV
jgi:hypothetical protein